MAASTSKSTIESEEPFWKRNRYEDSLSVPLLSMPLMPPFTIPNRGALPFQSYPYCLSQLPDYPFAAPFFPVTPVTPPELQSWQHHNMDRTEPGSRAEKKSCNRRNRGVCKLCYSNNDKSFSHFTTYRCSDCDIFLHPECFMEYHRREFNGA